MFSLLSWLVLVVGFIVAEMDRWRGKVAMVTGASSGIGEAIARELVKQGMVVVGAARRKERLDKLVEEMKGVGKMVARKADISKEEEVVELFGWVEESLGGADVLVNNAGILNYATIEDGEVEEWRSVLDVNLIGNMICTREFLRSLKRRGQSEGHIVVINSVAGHQIYTNDNVPPFYTASKHALRALSGCLRRTLAKQGSSVKVTDVCPGATMSSLVDNTERSGVFQTINTLDASDVADVVVSVLSASPRTQICDVIVNPVPTSVVTDVCPGATQSELLDNTDNSGLFQTINFLEASDIADVVVSVLSASPRTQICDVIVNPVPTSMVVY